MKFNRERYQHGSIREVPRSHDAFAWEFRFYTTDADGKRKLKVQTFPSAKYPLERDVRKAVEGQLAALNAGTLGGKVVATLETIIDRYMREEFPPSGTPRKRPTGALSTSTSVLSGQT